jgi:hypothetical protein
MAPCAAAALAVRIVRGRDAHRQPQPPASPQPRASAIGLDSSRVARRRSAHHTSQGPELLTFCARMQALVAARRGGVSNAAGQGTVLVRRRGSRRNFQQELWRPASLFRHLRPGCGGLTAFVQLVGCYIHQWSAHLKQITEFLFSWDPGVAQTITDYTTKIRSLFTYLLTYLLACLLAYLLTYLLCWLRCKRLIVCRVGRSDAALGRAAQ